MQKLIARGLHEQVIEEIGRRIVQCEYAPGQPLPGEAGLCELLGVSRTRNVQKHKRTDSCRYPMIKI